jgi:glycosyltransferase involved in cell wall biosynthesis
MRILVLCYEYPPIGGGGGRVAQSIATEMVKRGHEVRVQTAALGWRSQRETIDGVAIHRAASGRRAPDTCRVHEMAAYCATSFFPTLRHSRKWKPDVIHAHFAVPTGLLAWAVHRLTGVPYVLTAHLGDVPGGVPEQTDSLFQLITPVARQVWHHAAAATAVSSFVQELAERAYGRKVERILNGIDLGDQLLPPPQDVRRTRHFVFVGRFNPQKNLIFLVNVLAQLRSSNWHATFIGDGPDRAEVERLIAAKSLGNRIRLTGWLPAAGVSEVLRAGDVLCMPSLSEGLPVAAIEGLKHGLAIVASAIPGVRDVVEHGVNGYSLHLDESYAHKLEWLLESDSTLYAMKHASWNKARAFDLTLVASEYERVLRGAAESKVDER